MRTKVVMLSAFLTPFRSGAEACAEEVALHLADTYDMVIITARLRKDLPVHDSLQGRVEVRRIGFGNALDKWFYPFLAPFVARWYQPHIVHAVLETFAGLALVGCSVLTPKAKRLLTLQTTNRTFLRSFILGSPNTITAISSPLREDARRRGRRNVTLIPNGIALSLLREAANFHAKVRGRVLFVGRLERMKGIDTLLTAFKRTCEMLPPKEAAVLHLHIVGGGSQRAALEKIVKDLDIQNRVTFVGYLTPLQVAEEYAKAEVFCGLSRSEALGNVFLEALAAGCAVVATNVGGIPDSIKDGETGYLVPVDDAESAARAMTRLLHQPEIRAGMAKRGKAFAASYDWQTIADRYAKVYHALQHSHL